MIQKKNSELNGSEFFFLVAEEGFEPPAFRL